VSARTLSACSGRTAFLAITSPQRRTQDFFVPTSVHFMGVSISLLKSLWAAAKHCAIFRKVRRRLGASALSAVSASRSILAAHADLQEARIAIIRPTLQRQQRTEALATLIREHFELASAEPFSFLAARIETLAAATQWSNALNLLSAAQFIARHTIEGVDRDDS
jgi:hypothetical protein